MSRGRGRDRECRRYPNVVKDISNFNLTYLGLWATNLDDFDGFSVGNPLRNPKLTLVSR